VRPPRAAGQNPPGEEKWMFRRRRGESRGCCVVIPIGGLLHVLGVVLLSGLALAGLL